MPDRLSSHIRLVWSQGKDMSEAIALEVRTICRRAAEPIRPGETVKAQLRRAWENLGRPPLWRLRAGWYADAGSWSAAAVRDFQARYLALLKREARRVAQARAVEDLKSDDHLLVEPARDEFRTLVSRIEALEAAFRLQGQDEGRP